jgi:hypothetical protein
MHRKPGTRAIAALSALGSCTLAACAGGSANGPSPAGGLPPTRAAPASSFDSLRPAQAPRGWRAVTSASGQLTLPYPSTWTTLRGDVGSVTAALRDAGGAYVGYLNATPRQGAEQLHGWARYRTEHNRGEGDRNVHETAASEGLRFTRGHGSCVIDDYLSRVGSNHYREIACIVAGEHATGVFIGAALLRDWRQVDPVLERAAAAFRER